MTTDWWTIRDKVKAAGSFPALLQTLSRHEIEMHICLDDWQRNTFGNFPGTIGDRAREIYDEIERRANITQTLEK